MGVLEDLRRVVGEDGARLAESGDRVAEVPPRWVVAPTSTEQVGRVLRIAGEHDLHVVVRGSGTKLHWGAPPSAAELLLDMSRLGGVVEHAAGDLVAIVRAGTPLRDVQAALARSGQRLPLDEMLPGATIGGVVSAGTAGPLRLRFGTPRDQVIGVTMVRADGVTAHSGGKVVKNVAGYDLGRLFAGSYGTLGVLTEVAVKLAPVPEARAFVTRPVRTPAEVRDLTTRIREAKIGPVGMEVECPVPENYRRGGTVLRTAPDPDSMVLLLEGPADGVRERADRAVEALGTDTTVSTRPPTWWGRYPFGPDDVALQVVTPVGQLFGPVYSLRDAAREIPVRIFCSPAAGVLHAGVPGGTDPDRVARIVEAVRTVAISHGGYCQVLAAPPAVRAELDLWGPIDALGLMRAVKHEFDPAGRLAPGRFVGGI
ncbi:FAD-binding oxidoreductase [Actinocatenispora rupis]|uniref:Glycolate oxidase n=1 Tax=Actinocatenispora rupis TaxID=519421 RepID=A0A8J3J4Y1_9ACTN|nr:FAD-binding oxidoreductase [Actinocatenispora rupis]GID15851.1 glycolate oxidase [Actinocatenispora rupis]